MTSRSVLRRRTEGRAVGSTNSTRTRAMILGVRIANGEVGEEESYLFLLEGLYKLYAPQAAEVIAEGYVSHAARWARSGLPAIVTPHKLAASMMESNVSSSSLKDVRLPWPAFLVEIPDGLGFENRWVIATEFVDGGEHWLSIFGLSDKGRMIYMVTPPAPTMAESLQRAASHLRDDDPTRWAANLDDKPHDVGVSRQQAAIARLVLGICVEMSQKKIRDQIRVGPPAVDKIAMKRGKPKAWVFKLTRDVHVDARPMVRAYLAGHEGRTLGVQTMVRGHYKRQPYGEKNLLRRWVFIEPYWRGPEDAPMALRTHIIE